MGNLNFGAVGKALGIPEDLLLQQASAAQLQDHEGQGFLESQWNSLGLSNYGDQDDDHQMIINGFSVEQDLPDIGLSHIGGIYAIWPTKEKKMGLGSWYNRHDSCFDVFVYM